MRRDLPSGTVTFLFTDVEGSTKLLHELGSEGYAQALAVHRQVLREAFGRHGGVEVDTQGDAFFVAFPTAPGALAAAAEAQAELDIPVRMGLHTGSPFLAEEGYVGPDVNRAARIAACGHGGQVLEPGDGLELTDLGEHRLKDLSAPERILQLGAAAFPPLASLHETNLPVPATPFLGRESELGEIGALLERDDVRLLTLLGPGGTGKTRLALHAAAAAADDFPAGVWWVPLAPLREPALVLETAAKALGARTGLAEHVGDSRLLLVLDNFEHLIDAADGLADVLSVCRNLHVLVTSRELLQLPGEQAYPVPPLEAAEGRALFVARARGVKPDFQLTAEVSELCARLDNLPLAIELAAARVRMLTPRQLLERLAGGLDLLQSGRGTDARQQTLRATIAWSYELLAPEEQQLFAQLSVFRGGCTLDAAEQVCEAELDTLQSLVDKSLLRVREGERFWMLETIREYAAERLGERDDVLEVQARHTAFFVALAEEAATHLRGSPGGWLDRLDAEHDNLRAALDRLEAADAQGALGLAGALWKYWYQRAHHREGRMRLERALDADASATPFRARALNGATALEMEGGELSVARARAEEALALSRELGDAWGTANSVYILGVLVTWEADWARAQELFVESGRAFRELGDVHYGLLSDWNLAWMTEELGDGEGARVRYEQVLREARAADNERLESLALNALARFARQSGRDDAALSMLRRSLSIRERLGEPFEVADVLSRLAHTLAHGGRAEEATPLLASSKALMASLGVTRPWIVERDAETLDLIRARLDDGAFADAWSRGEALAVDEAVAFALDA
jgi:predicted ATPase